MKLYSEEEVNELCRALRDITLWDEHLEDDWEDAGNRAMDALRSFKKVIPIELPTDEEIVAKSKEDPDNSDIETAARIGYVAGAKWMRDKIQGGNK